MADWVDDGLLVASDDNKVFQSVEGGLPVSIRQSSQQMADGHTEMALVFSLPEPLRFNVGVPVPPGCVNACVTFNGHMLINWFSDYMPDGLPAIFTHGCQQHGTPVSTLRPGQVQNLNFRWHDDDLLRFYWVWS